jgi:hypothetical protein
MPKNPQNLDDVFLTYDPSIEGSIARRGYVRAEDESGRVSWNLSGLDKGAANSLEPCLEDIVAGLAQRSLRVIEHLAKRTTISGSIVPHIDYFNRAYGSLIKKIVAAQNRIVAAQNRLDIPYARRCLYCQSCLQDFIHDIKKYYIERMPKRTKDIVALEYRGLLERPQTELELVFFNLAQREGLRSRHTVMKLSVTDAAADRPHLHYDATLGIPLTLRQIKKEIQLSRTPTYDSHRLDYIKQRIIELELVGYERLPKKPYNLYTPDERRIFDDVISRNERELSQLRLVQKAHDTLRPGLRNLRTIALSQNPGEQPYTQVQTHGSFVPYQLREEEQLEATIDNYIQYLTYLVQQKIDKGEPIENGAIVKMVQMSLLKNIPLVEKELEQFQLMQEAIRQLNAAPIKIKIRVQNELRELQVQPKIMIFNLTTHPTVDTTQRALSVIAKLWGGGEDPNLAVLGQLKGEFAGQIRLLYAKASPDQKKALAALAGKIDTITNAAAEGKLTGELINLPGLFQACDQAFLNSGLKQEWVALRSAALSMSRLLKRFNFYVAEPSQRCNEQFNGLLQAGILRLADQLGIPISINCRSGNNRTLFILQKYSDEMHPCNQMGVDKDEISVDEYRRFLTDQGQVPVPIFTDPLAIGDCGAPGKCGDPGAKACMFGQQFRAEEAARTHEFVFRTSSTTERIDARYRLEAPGALDSCMEIAQFRTDNGLHRSLPPYQLPNSEAVLTKQGHMDFLRKNTLFAGKWFQRYTPADDPIVFSDDGYCERGDYVVYRDEQAIWKYIERSLDITEATRAECVDEIQLVRYLQDRSGQSTAGIFSRDLINLARSYQDQIGHGKILFDGIIDFKLEASNTKWQMPTVQADGSLLMQGDVELIVNSVVVEINNANYVAYYNASGQISFTPLHQFNPEMVGRRPVVELRAEVAISSNEGRLQAPQLLSSSMEETGRELMAFIDQCQPKIDSIIESQQRQQLSRQ